ncbi:MAG: DUF4393 domain-containing protein [Bacteroidetes bacterium]|nr:DUF4393 domain-containing protein [Bacteroidota bacterium]
MNELETLLPILNQAGISNLNEAIEFTDQYLGGTLRQVIMRLGLILDDSMRLWQFKNQVRIALKAKEYCEQKGIKNPRKLENAVAIPLIEDTRNIEDENLSNMFSGLLACQLDPEEFSKVHPSYSKTLLQLSPIDANIINDFFISLKSNSADYRKFCLDIELIKKMHGYSEDVITLSFQNLWRLGICDHGDLLNHLNRKPQVVFTDYGWWLLNACCKTNHVK